MFFSRNMENSIPTWQRKSASTKSKFVVGDSLNMCVCLDLMLTTDCRVIFPFVVFLQSHVQTLQTIHCFHFYLWQTTIHQIIIRLYNSSTFISLTLVGKARKFLVFNLQTILIYQKKFLKMYYYYY